MDTHSTGESVLSLRPRCQLWYIGDIRELLSESNMSLFRESCFGHLMDIGEILFQGELLKLLCMRLHSSSLDRNTLEFNLGGHDVEFGGADYCLMSGLEFSGDTSLPKHSKFHGVVFGSRTNLVFADIEKEFRKECAFSGGQSVRSLKLAYLIIIYGLLVFNDQDSGKVDLRYLHLMDDLKMFNAFPWGIVSYQYLVSSTHRLKRAMSSVLEDMLTSRMEAFGFVYALQCWAYEVIPTLGIYCATLNAQHLNSFPRILKWIVTRNLNSKDEGLRNFFLASHGSEPVRISLSSLEITKLGELGVTPSMHVASPSPWVQKTKNVGRKLDFGSGDGKKSSNKKQSSKRKSSRLGSSQLKSTAAKTIDEEDCSIIEPQDMKRLYSKVKKNRKGACFVSEGTPRSDSYSNTQFVTPEGASVTVDAKLHDISMLVVSLKGQIKCLEEYIDMRFKDFEGKIEKRRDGVGCSCDLKVSNISTDISDSKKVPDANMFDGTTEALTKASNFNSPFTTNIECDTDHGKTAACGRTCMKATSTAVCLELGSGLSKYDPNDQDMSITELGPFVEWFRDATKYPREKLIMLPTEIFQYADLDWFNTLWSPDGWLDNTHIDALINLVIIKFDKETTLKNGRNWTCMEICCWQALTRSSLIDILPIVMPYVGGERPVSGGLRWCEVDHIFGIANIKNSHWVFFDVSLEDQVITVYNSLEDDWEPVSSHFLNVQKNLPIVCNMSGLWDSSTRQRKPLKSYWNLVNYSGAPKQVNHSDCGIMALKFLECLAYNVPVEELNPILCLDSRKRYCAKLFDLSKEFTVCPESD